MGQKSEEGQIPGGQRFYDNIILILVLGIVVPTVIYTVWGLYEVMTTPKLPFVP